MKQIIQDLKNGSTILEEVPAPIVKPGYVLIKTTRTLVSLGTERMLVEFGRANFIEKARQQPDKVKMVLDKMKTDGILPTVEAVFTKLGMPLPLGYCNVGEVIAVGTGVEEFKIGDRVASNGNHAEFVCVPKNLVASIPDNVSDDEAAFTVIGSIGLQGIRLIDPTFGETIVVIGLGLIGLVTAELLVANGCKVIGFDFDPVKVEMAKSKGIVAINPMEGTDQVKFVLEQTNRVGADGVIITASAKSNEIISQSAKMSRKRGRVVLVGVVGLDISRADFFEKEITFQVSCSYGPGRYDDDYEQKGKDYPIGFVRWTEKRNFETVLNAISKKQLDVIPLITEKVDLLDFQNIYGDMNKSGSIASILKFPSDSQHSTMVELESTSYENRKGVFGIIGAGNYTAAMIIPRLKEISADIKYISSAGGLSSAILAKKAGIARVTTDYKEILNDKEVDTIIITTRHNLHAKLVMEGLHAQKNVFVEKPLCLNYEELSQIEEVYKGSKGTLMVGFNRRFAPLAEKMKSVLGNSPMNIIATMNAGEIPPDMWVHDLEVGGGRIVGEACHYVDMCSFLTGSKIIEVCMNSMGIQTQENTDNASILLKYENGSTAVINYFSNGNKAYSKERVEVFSQGRNLIMDNWRTLKGYGFKGFSSQKTGQDKGQKNQFSMLNDRIKSGGESIIPADSIFNTTRATLAVITSLKEGKWVSVD